jgi:hypothetical protein
LRAERSRVRTWKPFEEKPSPSKPPKFTDPKPVKATSKKKASKKAAAKATKVKPDKVEEIDPSKLKLSDAQKRCASIYKLERAVEAAKNVHDNARKRAKETRGKLIAAEKALGSEIHEQRLGPGPLYNPTGGKK